MKKYSPLAEGQKEGKIMMIFASILSVLMLVSEGIMAHEKKDGSMFLVVMQVAAFAAACVWQRKETAIFFVCAVLTAMFKFYIVDVSRER